MSEPGNALQSISQKPLVKMGGVTPLDVATAAVLAAGYRDFRHLAQVILENGWEELSSAELAQRTNLSPELLEQMMCLEEFLQELSWATIFQFAGQPKVLKQVVGRLTNIALKSDDEYSLAAQRIYISLLARMGMLPREEKPRVNLGVQLNIINNHPTQEEVVVIDDTTPQTTRREKGLGENAGLQPGLRPEAAKKSEVAGAGGGGDVGGSSADYAFEAVRGGAGL